MVKLLIAIAVVVIAALVAYPQPEVNWEGRVYPMAREYTKRATGTTGGEHPLSGVVVLVTGATNGIGMGLTKTLSKMGATVIAHGRSEKKLSALVDEIPGLLTVRADLMDLQDVSRAADELLLRADVDRIDVLMNNAGMHDGLFGGPPAKQGYDRVFTVNYLSHFLLTEKLMPLLNNSTNPVVVQMSSTYHWAVDGSDLVPVIIGDGGGTKVAPIASVPGGGSGRFVDEIFRTQRSYANSKLAQILHARAMKQRHSDDRVRFVSVCPSWVSTQIAQNAGPASNGLIGTLGYSSEGWGLTSAMEAIFTTGKDEDDGDDFYSNTMFFKILPPLMKLLPGWAYRMGLRDIAAANVVLLSLFWQRPVSSIQAEETSTESYNSTLGDALYEWSHSAVAEYM